MLQTPSVSKVLCGAITLLFVLITAAPAMAQDDEARMQELVEQAATAFSEKRYADSAQLFEDAHEAQANPTLLKNAMVAWYKAKQCDRAVHAGANFYREARNVGSLEAKDQSEIQTVVSCSLNLAQQRIDEGRFADAEDLLFTATSAGPSDEQTDRIATLRDTLRTKRSAGDTSGGVGDASDSPPDAGDDDGGMNTLALTGWAVTGVGVVGLLGTAIYSLSAASTERDALSNCKVGDQISSSDYGCLDAQLGLPPGTVDRAYYENEIADPINSAQTTSIIFYSLSGVATAAGVGILVYHYFLGDMLGQEAAVTVSPMVGPDSAGAQLHWRF